MDHFGGFFGKALRTTLQDATLVLHNFVVLGVYFKTTRVRLLLVLFLRRKASPKTLILAKITFLAKTP